MRDEPSPPSIGDVIAGKYRVEKVLGSGGMGLVVAARHVQLDTRVAIKFLLPEKAMDGEAVARFAREAKAAVKITSEHVARVFDVGTLDSGAPYMVMEFLEGGDLAAWVEQRGPLPVELAVEFVLQAGVAVAEAHGLGIVHRDLKPANLFCIRRPDGQLSVKVLDFGISKLTGAGAEGNMAFTKTSDVMGSPLYMSPEQMQSARSADLQSDVWALGVILYELLAGRVPFEGEGVAEIAVKVMMQPPPSLSGLRAEVPAGLEAVVFKCLEKQRQHRYKDVAQLALALAEFAPARARGAIERITGTVHASEGPPNALELPPSGPRSGSGSAGTIDPTGNTARALAPVAPRRNMLVTISLGFTVALAIVVAVFRTVAVSPPPKVETASAPASASPPDPAPPVAEPDAASVPAEANSVPSSVPPVPKSATTPAIARPPTPHRHVDTPAGCDPPYTLDAKGHKHFRPECYLQ